MRFSFITILCFFSLTTLLSENKSNKDRHPTAVTYLCIDFKYSKKTGIKICEMQIAKDSGGLENIDFDMNHNGYFAEQFYKTLGKYFDNICFIQQSMKYATFEEQAKKQGVLVYKSLNNFFQYLKSKKLFFSPPANRFSAASYGCLLLTSLKDLPKAEYLIQKHYPKILLMDQAFLSLVKTSGRSNHKENVDTFLKDIMKRYKRFNRIRPNSKVYPATYTPQLSQDIVKSIGGNVFVIKPLEKSCGEGVIMVHKRDLDDTLQNILQRAIPDAIKQGKEIKQYEKYSFWEKYPQQKFLVEKFVKSDTFISPADGKPYDPSMRTFALLVHNHGDTKVFILGSYIKIPSHALNSKGSLIAKHCSHSPPIPHTLDTLPILIKEKIERQRSQYYIPQTLFSVPLSMNKEIEKQFQAFLPIFHKKLLKKYHSS